MSLEAVQAAAEALHAALTDCAGEALTVEDRLAVGEALQILGNQLPSHWHPLIARLQAETTPRELGAKSWHEVLRTRWRLSDHQASQRLADAAVLGPRQTVPGQPLPPLLPAVAAAQGLGLLTGDHVKTLRDALRALPSFVDTDTAACIEVDWVRKAIGVGPKELGDYVARARFLLDQDGPPPDEKERDRKRGVTTGKQGADAMTALTATLTPEAAAVWEPLFAKYAAPGMCNPADEHPCTAGTPSQAQIDDDDRSLAQRQHDALIAVGRIALMSGDLGQLNGLPVSIIVRTTLQELHAHAGIGVTGGGTVLSIHDVIRLGAHANHYLAIFDHATGSAMDLLRAKRTASPAQRIMLIARDGGCTKPGCTVGAYGSQAHHAAKDWVDGGQTNVDELGLACGGDNRMVDDDGGWTTRINERHDVEWIPPEHLDTGQDRINTYHRPEQLHPPTNNWEPPPAPPPAEPAPPPAGPPAEVEREAEPLPEREPKHSADYQPTPTPVLDDPWSDEPEAAPEPEPATDADHDSPSEATNDNKPTPSLDNPWAPEPETAQNVKPVEELEPTPDVILDNPWASGPESARDLELMTVSVCTLGTPHHQPGGPEPNTA